MRNLFKVFRDLIPQPPLLVGTVTAISGGVATISLPDGGVVQGRGQTTVGARVFVRDGVIEGTAPSLTSETIEI